MQPAKYGIANKDKEAKAMIRQF